MVGELVDSLTGRRGVRSFVIFATFPNDGGQKIGYIREEEFVKLMSITREKLAYFQTK